MAKSPWNADLEVASRGPAGSHAGLIPRVCLPFLCHHPELSLISMNNHGRSHLLHLNKELRGSRQTHVPLPASQSFIPAGGKLY